DGWRGGNNIEIVGNTIIGANHMGIDTYAKQSSIHENVISYVAVIELLNQAGMGCPTDSSGGVCTEDGDGIRLKVDKSADSGHSNAVYRNLIFGIGYNGIDVFGSGNTFTNNRIIEACYSKGDCGAVRTFGGNSLSDTPVYNLTFQGNMLFNTIGNTDGCHTTYSAPFGFGLYIDHYSKDIVSTGNTITGSTSHGILYQDSTGQITNNTLYDNASGSAYAAQIALTGAPTFVSPMSGNVMYSLKTTAWTLSAADADRMANSNGNYFFNPYLPQHINVSGAKTLAEWQTFSGQDSNSVENWFQQSLGDDPLSTIFYNIFDTTTQIDLGGTQYLDLDQNPVVGTLILAPYTSQILIDNGPAALTLFNISPSLMAVADAADFTLTLTGAGFTENSIVRWNGADRPTTFVSATTLTAEISATDVDEVGSFSVTVYDPGPPEEETGAVMFWVVEEVWEVWLPVVGR
ncbi:MAG: right-handed parallel beta-helix repeat-containing protein, partial [Anaerolineales bacterium]|nr:right-handed parallel beta-helix repeat-containing protein [Anaerolineales bacterium]